MLKCIIVNNSIPDATVRKLLRVFDSDNVLKLSDMSSGIQSWKQQDVVDTLL